LNRTLGILRVSMVVGAGAGTGAGAGAGASTGILTKAVRKHQAEVHVTAPK